MSPRSCLLQAPLLVLTACGGGLELIEHHDVGAQDGRMTWAGPVLAGDGVVHRFDHDTWSFAPLPGEGLVLSDAADLSDTSRAVVLEPAERRVVAEDLHGWEEAVVVDTEGTPLWAGYTADSGADASGGWTEALVVVEDGRPARATFHPRDGRQSPVSVGLVCDGEPVRAHAFAADAVEAGLWASTDHGILHVTPDGATCFDQPGAAIVDAGGIWGGAYLYLASPGDPTIRTRDQDGEWGQFEVEGPFRDVSFYNREVAVLSEDGTQVDVYDGTLGELLCTMDLGRSYDGVAYTPWEILAWDDKGVDRYWNRLPFLQRIFD